MKLKDVRLKMVMHLNLGGGGHSYAFKNEELGICMTRTKQKRGAAYFHNWSCASVEDGRLFDDLEEFKRALIAAGVVEAS